MTGFGDVFVALIFLWLANVVVLRHIRSRHDPETARFLERVYLWTLLARAALAFALNLSFGSTFFALFWGDSSSYHFDGGNLAAYWRGEMPWEPPLIAQGWGMSYLVGAFYYVFGANALLVQFFNCTLGSLTVLVIHAMARELFDAKVAGWAAQFMAFFPQMIFWSAGLYKDPAVLLCIAVAMRSVLAFRTSFQVRQASLYLGAVLALFTLRFYVCYMVVIATLGTLAFIQQRGFARGLAYQVGIGLLLLGTFSFALNRETIEQQNARMDLETLQVARADQANQASSAFLEEIDVSTPEGALSALPEGTLYLLFAPFPWSIGSFRQALTIPEMLVWYSLMPALWRGLRYVVRNKFRDALPILVFAAMLTVAYGVFQSNVGTAYRQRTQIAMFFFILMGVGLVHGKAPGVGRPAGARA